MQLAQIPTRIAVPWASGGGKNVILTPSQVNSNPGKASWIDGFPPATRTALVAGGKAPDGLDMNGVLFSVSQWSQWLAAGHPTTFDAAFATAISGYPVGARIIGANNSVWVSKTDGNFADPTFYLRDSIPENQRQWAQVAFYADIGSYINSLNLNSLYVKQGNITSFSNNNINLAWDSAAGQLIYSIDSGNRVDRLIDSTKLGSFGINTFFVTGAASGNFTIPTNVFRILVQMVGGGGGGGGSDWVNSGIVHTTGGGGGAGGFVEFGLNVTPGTLYSYVVGGGGAAGPLSQAGSAGGTTIFSNLAIAYGGIGGGSATNDSAGGVGGSTVTYVGGPYTFFFVKGGSGADGQLYSNTGDPHAVPGGHGGASFFGGGGAGTLAGNPAGTSDVWGSGGGGSRNLAPTAGFQGSAGAIIIRY